MKVITENRIEEIKKETGILLGKAIKETRQSLQIKQTQLAIAIGKDRQYLHKIESGKVTANVATIKLIAEAMEIPLEKLVASL